MSTIKRIKEFIDFKGLTNQKFEKAIGFSNGAFSSQLRNNKTIGVDKLEKILIEFPEINVEWLLTGKGEMLRGNNNTQVNNEINIDFKELAEARKELLEYKDKEILYLKNKVEEMTVDLEIYSDHFKDEARKSLTNKSKKT